MKFIISIAFLFLYTHSSGQKSTRILKGYVIKETYDSMPANIFFIKSSSNFPLFKPLEIITSLSTKDTTWYFLNPFDSIFKLISKELNTSSIKIRNESKVFIARGIYRNTLKKYKDDYFHITIIPAEVELGEVDISFYNPFASVNSFEYEIKCFDKIITSKYYTNPAAKVYAVKFPK